MWAIKRNGKYIMYYTDGDWSETNSPEPTVFEDSCYAKVFLVKAVKYYSEKDSSNSRWVE